MLKLCRCVFLPWPLAHGQLLQQWDQPATDLAGYWWYLEMVRHLIWEEGAQNWGKIFVTPLPLSRESIRDIISLPHKPLAISLHVRVQKYLHIFSHHVYASWCLDKVITGLAEVQFLYPAFGCGAVCHQQCTVPWVEASANASEVALCPSLPWYCVKSSRNVWFRDYQHVSYLEKVIFHLG